MIIKTEIATVVVDNRYLIQALKKEYIDLKNECQSALAMLEESNFDNGWVGNFENKIAMIDEKLSELSKFE